LSSRAFRRLCDDTPGTQWKNTATPTGSSWCVDTRDVHEQAVGLHKRNILATSSGGVARRASLHRPATNGQAVGLKNTSFTSYDEDSYMPMHVGYINSAAARFPADEEVFDIAAVDAAVLIHVGVRCGRGPIDEE